MHEIKKKYAHLPGVISVWYKLEWCNWLWLGFDFDAF